MAEIGPHDQWARVAADLRQYRQEQEATWGTIDDATLGRYLAGEMAADERKRVEAALEQHPQLRDLVSLVGEVLSDPVEVSPPTPPVVVVPARDEAPAVLPFAPVKKPSVKRSPFRLHHAAMLAAAACVLLAVALPPLLGWLRLPWRAADPIQVAELSPPRGERGGVFPGKGADPRPGGEKTMLRGGAPRTEVKRTENAERDTRRRALEEGRLVPFSFDAAEALTAAPALPNPWRYERGFQPSAVVRTSSSYPLAAYPACSPPAPEPLAMARGQQGTPPAYFSSSLGQRYLALSLYYQDFGSSPYERSGIATQTFPAGPAPASPLPDIHGGKALNDLLDYLKARQGKDSLPAKDLPPSLLGHINVTTAEGGHHGVLKHAGRLPWPEALRDRGYAAERKRVEQLAVEAVAQAKSDGRLQEPTVRELTAAVDGLRKRLTEQINELTPAQYIEAKRFLNSVGAGCKALERKDAANFFNQTYAAKGRTVAELVQYMTDNRLRFAPAVPGDEAAYQALYAALQATARALPQKTKAPIPR